MSADDSAVSLKAQPQFPGVVGRSVVGWDQTAESLRIRTDQSWRRFGHVSCVALWTTWLR